MLQSLPPDMAEWVEVFLSTGEFSNAEDVLRKALGALQEKTDLEAIRAGLAEFEAGLGRSLEEIDAEIRATHNFRLSNDREGEPDRCERPDP